MSAPRISIVMSVYNAGRYLRQTLQGIQDQTWTDWELIAVNDGSTDDSLAILQDVAQVERRICIIDQPNRGLTAALKTGCAAAQGELIARHDDDDWSSPLRLERLLAVLDSRPDAALVGSWAVHFDDQGHVIDHVRPEADPVAATRNLLDRHVGPAAHGSVMFRKADYESAGGYRTAFYFAQDLDLWYRLAAQGLMVIVPEELYFARISPLGISGVWTDFQIQFGNLARQSYLARARGKSDESLVAEAEVLTQQLRQIRSTGTGRRKQQAAAHYRIGTCQSRQANPAALGHFLATVRMNPLHWRGWCRLSYEIVRRPLVASRRTPSAKPSPISSSARPERLDASDVAIAIPTFGRDEVLLDTINHCLELVPPAGELLVIDQTPKHSDDTEARLQYLDQTGEIRWLRTSPPSIPRAMNLALTQATRSAVLFLDDDVIPTRTLVESHVSTLNDSGAAAVVGQIIQPWQTAADLPPPENQRPLTIDLEFPFNTTRSAWIENVMAGNLCVRRDAALSVGGFDENFYGAAYRFETDFARRLVGAGSRIRFCPEGSLQHLRVERGGTRSSGDHRSSASPIHGVGDYYFAMRHGRPFAAAVYMGRRLFREVATRFHLKQPWYIPVKLIGEVRALFWAARLTWRGPRLINETALQKTPPRPFSAKTATVVDAS